MAQTSDAGRREALARSVEASVGFLTRYLAGFTDDNRTSRGPGAPNHAAWTLGHLAFTMHRAAYKIGGSGIPARDFVRGDGTGGDAERFDTESVCLGSVPTNEAGRYPRMDRARAIFGNACGELASVVREADDADLDRIVPWVGGRTRVDTS